MKPAVRSERERADPHPVYKAFMDMRVSQNFSREEVRSEVVPAYMGLIKQVDDQIGVLMADLERRGLKDDTLILFTADHGDYLGDHWLGEKDLFHEPSVKVPFIVVDPRAEADATRGTTCDALVEVIDCVPTFLEALGGDPAKLDHILEGRSLMPWLHGETPAWRTHVFSEYDYSILPVGAALKRAPKDCRLFMVFDGRWKMIHAIGFRPMLFDLETDPDELDDRGADEACAAERERLFAALQAWGLRQSQRTTLSEQQMLARRGSAPKRGILIGVFDETELADELWAKYRG
jgi:arylsulfatase A-like enzyme